jgi:hypothetical protein
MLEIPETPTGHGKVIHFFEKCAAEESCSGVIKSIGGFLGIERRQSLK